MMGLKLVIHSLKISIVGVQRSNTLFKRNELLIDINDAIYITFIRVQGLYMFPDLSSSFHKYNTMSNLDFYVIYEP